MLIFHNVIYYIFNFSSVLYIILYIVLIYNSIINLYMILEKFIFLVFN